MKTLLLAGILSLTAATAVYAGVKPIAEWEGTLPGRGETQQTVTHCTEACPGYDIVTVYCPDGQELESCPQEGCAYYHRCR